MKRQDLIMLTTLAIGVSMLAACGHQGKTGSASIKQPSFETRMRSQLALFASSQQGAFDPTNPGNEEFAGRVEGSGATLETISTDPAVGNSFTLKVSFVVKDQPAPVSATGTMTIPTGTKPMLTGLTNDAQTPNNYRFEAICGGPTCKNVMVRIFEQPTATPDADAADAAALVAKATGSSTSSIKQVVAFFSQADVAAARAANTASRRAKTLQQKALAARKAAAAAPTSTASDDAAAAVAAADQAATKAVAAAAAASTASSATTTTADGTTTVPAATTGAVDLVLEWISSPTASFMAGHKVKLSDALAARGLTNNSSTPNPVGTAAAAAAAGAAPAQPSAASAAQGAAQGAQPTAPAADGAAAGSGMTPPATATAAPTADAPAGSGDIPVTTPNGQAAPVMPAAQGGTDPVPMSPPPAN